MDLKLSFVVALCFAATFAHPQGDAVINRYESDNIGLGNYNYAYETSNGISHQEQAQLKNAGTEDEAMVVQGSYSYYAPDGQQYTVQYVADENGFRPQGAHLPSN